MAQADVVMFFYLTSLISLITVEFRKLLPFGKDEDVNIVSSFVFVSVTYAFFLIFQRNLKNGNLGYDAKVLYSIFLLTFSAIFLILSKYKAEFVKFDTDAICETLNDRFEKIATASQAEGMLSLCNETSLALFYAFIFSFCLANLYRYNTRVAYFDNLLVSAADRAETINRSLTNVNSIKYTCKVKQVLTVFMLLACLDPLLKIPLVEDNIISELNFTILVLFPLVLSVFVLDFILMRYQSSLFLNDNYYTMLEFCSQPNKERLPALRSRISYMNTKFWEIYENLAHMAILPLLLFLYFINRSDSLSTLTSEQPKFYHSFMEVMAYFMLLAVIISKSVFSLCYSFYLQNFSQEKSFLYI